MSTHPTTVELSDVATGASGRPADHVTWCEECRARVDELRQLRQTLANDPAPTMPADVAARLQQVVRAEADRRHRGEPDADAARGPARMTPLGTFGENPLSRKRIPRREVPQPGRR